jgi:hypothetical protein
MALERTFDVDDINLLLDQNSMPPYGQRNSALIMAGVAWGLTPLEMSLITTEDIMAINGEFFRIWVLPAHASYNGEPREIRTEDHLLPFFESYVKFRIENEWCTSNLESHRGLAPDKPFLLNDQGKPYKLTERKAKPGSYQARSMTEHLKRMIARTDLYGATPASFRDSFIKGMHDAGCGWADLMKVTGIKQKRTLENKVRPHEKELEKVLKSLFSRVRMPGHLK